MRKSFIIVCSSVILAACDFKDNSGNAPLIDDGNGNLIDNPAYVDHAKQEEEAQRKKDVKRISEGMKAWSDSAVAADKGK